MSGFTPGELFAKAHEAGLKACEGVPDTGPVGYSKCRIDGRTVFAKWCCREGHGRNADYGSMFGKGTWISDQAKQQALEASNAYIKAFAAVLQAEGIETFTWGWYD